MENENRSLDKEKIWLCMWFTAQQNKTRKSGIKINKKPLKLFMIPTYLIDQSLIHGPSPVVFGASQIIRDCFILVS